MSDVPPSNNVINYSGPNSSNFFHLFHSRTRYNRAQAYQEQRQNVSDKLGTIMGIDEFGAIESAIIIEDNGIGISDFNSIMSAANIDNMTNTGIGGYKIGELGSLLKLCKKDGTVYYVTKEQGKDVVCAKVVFSTTNTPVMTIINFNDISDEFKEYSTKHFQKYNSGTVKFIETEHVDHINPKFDKSDDAKALCALVNNDTKITLTINGTPFNPRDNTAAELFSDPKYEEYNFKAEKEIAFSWNETFGLWSGDSVEDETKIIWKKRRGRGGTACEQARGRSHTTEFINPMLKAKINVFAVPISEEDFENKNLNGTLLECGFVWIYLNGNFLQKATTKSIKKYLGDYSLPEPKNNPGKRISYSISFTCNPYYRKEVDEMIGVHPEKPQTDGIKSMETWFGNALFGAFKEACEQMCSKYPPYVKEVHNYLEEHDIPHDDDDIDTLERNFKDRKMKDYVPGSSNTAPCWDNTFTTTSQALKKQLVSLKDLYVTEASSDEDVVTSAGASSDEDVVTSAEAVTTHMQDGGSGHIGREMVEGEDAAEAVTIHMRDGGSGHIGREMVEGEDAVDAVEAVVSSDAPVIDVASSGENVVTGITDSGDEPMQTVESFTRSTPLTKNKIDKILQDVSNTLAMRDSDTVNGGGDFVTAALKFMNCNK